MSEKDRQPIVIVRRYVTDEDKPKGGVWKIAHADFMTAMMAFFLVMWLINVTDKETRTSVANYFNPVKLAQSTPDRKGLKEPRNTAPGAEIDAENKTTPFKGNVEEEMGLSRHIRQPRFKENALFQDPYAILAKLAAESERTSQPSQKQDDSASTKASGGESERDPFDPAYWQMAPREKSKGETADSAGKGAQAAPREGRPDAAAVITTPSKPDHATKPDNAAKTGEATLPGTAGAAPAAPGQPAVKETVASAAAELKSEIEKILAPASRNSPAPRLDVRATSEGVLISLTDDIDFSMFAIGSAEPEPKVVRAMEKVAKAIASRRGNVVVRGHTDDRPFRSETYDNWRLSTARAHMASYMLIRGGLSEGRIERVEGHADRLPKNPADRKAAENRRIEILLRETP